MDINTLIIITMRCRLCLFASHGREAGDVLMPCANVSWQCKMQITIALNIQSRCICNVGSITHFALFFDEMWGECLYKSSLMQSIIIILLGSIKGQFVKLCLIGSQMRKPQHQLQWDLFHLFSLSLCRLSYLLMGWSALFSIIHVFVIYYFERY